jgi:DNA-binding transcriptional LysR family regulator
MRFEKLDLNLLVVLDALLQDKSVSAAAERLNLSQSGASAALARLREFFEDDLLVPTGRTMNTTPRADKLIEPVRFALDNIRDTILTPQIFDPSVSDRTITITAIDYVVQVLLTQAISTFAKEAPHMRFRIDTLTTDPVAMLQRGLTDIIIGLDYIMSPEHPSEWLYDERFVVINWKGNTELKGPLTREVYEAAGHVCAMMGRQVPGFDETALRRLGIERRIEVYAPNYTSVARLVLGTNRIATIHERLAAQLKDTLPLDVHELPFEFPTVREVIQWSSRNTADPAIAWVVSRIKAIAGAPLF